jgi:quercetin dioxygenase-like cupin family protein
MRVIHLVTGADGQSHVREETHDLGGWEVATGISFAETASGGDLAWHVAPRRQYVLTLSGRLEFTTRGGETFSLGPGDVLLAEDTIGGGHEWRIVGPDPWRRAYISLETISPMITSPKTTSQEDGP